MNEKEFKENASRLEQIGKVLNRLPSEVRGEAFHCLKEYVSGQSSPSPSKGAAMKASVDSGDSASEEFFGRFEHEKADRNVRLIAAHLYNEYGTEPFTASEVAQIADEVGVTIPKRVDMTLISAQESGKKLFTRAGRSKFKPTVHGEAYLKSTYSVRKGTKKRPVDKE